MDTDETSEARKRKLAEFLLKRIVPLFKCADRSIDPWWWPIGVGRDWKQWFRALEPSDVSSAAGRPAADLLSSLQRGPSDDVPHKVEPEAYASFLGFWGDGVIGGRVVAVVSDRPSLRAYPKGTITALTRVLDEAGYQGVHVTDFVKRRGPAGSPALPPEESLNWYAALLVEELTIVAGGRLEPLHIVPMHASAFQLIVNRGVASKLKERLKEGVTLPVRAPIFPWGTNYPRADVVRSWRAAL